MESEWTRYPEGTDEAGRTSLAPLTEGVWQAWAGWAGLAVVLATLGARYCLLAPLRAMEFDQICTLITAQAPSWHTYLAAISIDSQPPFCHVATRLGLWLPLPQGTGVHLVSVLCIALGAVCLFQLFQRRGAPLAGLCSSALFASSRCVEFMFTVRPYAALIAVSALAVLVYDTYRLQRTMGRATSRWHVALVIVLAAAIHALSLVYVLAPIAAGELLHWIRTRRLDKPLLATVAIASTAFSFDFALAHRVQNETSMAVPLSARTPGLPTAAKLLEVLTFPVERRWQALLLVTVFAGTLLLWKRWRVDSGSRARNDALIFPLLAAVALYLAGAAAFVLGLLNHYFFPRYGAPVFLCGALLLGAAFASSAWRRLPAIPLVVAVVLLLLPLPALGRLFRTAPKLALPRESNAVIFQRDSIISSPVIAPTLWWYATPEQRVHMHVLTDATRYRTLPDGIPEATLRSFAAAGLLPFPLTPLQDYKFGDQVYLVQPRLSGDTWVPAFLTSNGYSCRTDTDLHSEAYTGLRCVRGTAAH